MELPSLNLGRCAFELPLDLNYLNCASLGPRLKCVQQAGLASLAATAAPWNTSAADWFEPSRNLEALFAALLGAPASCITLVPAVSYGVAVAAKNVPFSDGANVVVLEQEYPSNYYSWQRLAKERHGSVRFAGGNSTDITASVVEAIDRDTAVVAVPQCRWTDGALLDLHRIGTAARKNGAALVIDASQSMGAMSFDLDGIQPDFVTSVGYKWLLGPYGLAYLYAHERWHDQGHPLEESWLHRAGSEDFDKLVDYTDRYAPGAARFGGGASAHFHLVAMATAALSTISLWTPAKIQQKLSCWNEELVESIGDIASVPPRRVGHMVGLRPHNPLPPSFATSMRSRGVHIGLRGGVIRVSPHVHSSRDELHNLLGALKTSIAI